MTQLQKNSVNITAKLLLTALAKVNASKPRKIGEIESHSPRLS
jgi:hypothetical protein